MWCLSLSSLQGEERKGRPGSLGYRIMSGIVIFPKEASADAAGERKEGERKTKLGEWKRTTATLSESDLRKKGGEGGGRT